jgi:hypothetical protein
MKQWFIILGICFGLFRFTQDAKANHWKAEGEIGWMAVSADMDDSQNPAVVNVRIENRSQRDKLTISRYFVQMTDGDQRPVRPVAADEIVSEKLQILRSLLPDSVHEIDVLMGEIRADYPQEKIVAVYGKLKTFMDQGRPQDWRSSVLNWVSGVKSSQPNQYQQAHKVIDDIGELSQKFLWPRDIAPTGIYSGMLYFERPAKDPPSIYFEMNKKFVGLKMTQVEK